MILDLIIIGIILLLVIIGVVRGIAKTLLNLLSVAASGVISYLAAGLVSNFIYTAFISPTIISGVAESVAESTAGADKIVQETVNGLPEFLVNIFNIFGISTDELIKSAGKATDFASDNIGQAVALAIKPAVTSVLSVILIIVFFILLLIICKFIAKRIEKLFHIPIIGSINRFLGGALGLCEGIVLCCIGILVCRIALSLSGEPFISPELISHSVIFGAVYYSEFLNSVASFIAMGNNAIDTVSNIAETSVSEFQSAVN